AAGADLRRAPAPGASFGADNGNLLLAEGMHLALGVCRHDGLLLRSSGDVARPDTDPAFEGAALDVVPGGEAAGDEIAIDRQPAAVRDDIALQGDEQIEVVHVEMVAGVGQIDAEATPIGLILVLLYLRRRD